MKTTLHGDYLLRLTRFGAMNCYLVREDDGFTLIDTTISGSATMILDAAQKYGLPIVRIVLTHAHNDHVASLDALHALLPNAEVMITVRDARFLAGDNSLDANEPQVKLRGSYTICKTRPTTTLNDGDRIKSLLVVATPGHTPGHASFLDTRDRTLIAGDAMQTLGGIAVAGTFKPLFPLPALATWHKPLALQSARTLRALEPSQLAVGHGRVIVNPGQQIDQAIATLAQELAEQKQHVA